MRNPLASGFVGPLAPYANAIAEQLRGQGYAPWTVQDKLHVVAKLSRWLEEHHLPVGVLDEQQACIFLHEFHGQERRGAMVTRRRCVGCSSSCQLKASFPSP